jgi:thioredoxin 1
MVNTEEEYYKAIGKATVLVDAYAEWCHPCKVMSPVLDNIANVYRSVEFIKFDVDKLPKIAQELNIRAMPTFSIFKNGEFKEEFVGANPGKISKMIERHMDEKPEPW